MSGADRLNQAIADCMHKEFVRGEFDCTQFAIDCEIAQHGETLFPEFYRTYSSKKGGFAILLRLGFTDSWQCASSRLNEVPLHKVQRGDLVGHMAPKESLAVAANQHTFWAANGDGGLTMRPMTEAFKAWSFRNG